MVGLPSAREGARAWLSAHPKPDCDYPEVVDYFSIVEDLDYYGEAVNHSFDILVNHNSRPDRSRNGSSHLLGDSGPL